MLSSRPVVSRRASTLLIALAAASPWALAQNAAKPGAAAAAAAPLAWPTKPLKIIVGFPAGSSPDLTARTFSEPLSKALGQPKLQLSASGLGFSPSDLAVTVCVQIKNQVHIAPMNIGSQAQLRIRCAERQKTVAAGVRLHPLRTQ